MHGSCLRASVCVCVFPCCSDGSALNDRLSSVTRITDHFSSVAGKRWYKFLSFSSFCCSLLMNVVRLQINDLLSMKGEHAFIKVANSHAFVSKGAENKLSNGADLKSVFLQCSVLEPV